MFVRNIYILFFILLIGCQTTPPLTPQQRRTLQTRIYEASYETVFRAFKTVMQDEGYIIKNQDMMGGLIVAEAQSANRGAVFLQTLSLFDSHNRSHPTNYRTGQTFSWSVNLEEIQKGKVEARLILQRSDSFSQGGQVGREILKPEVYRNIFVKVDNEVARRKALKR